MKTRKISYVISVLIIIAVLLANSSLVDAKVIYSPSSWASQKLAISQTVGITPDGFDDQPFIRSITRKNFCELLINTCRALGASLPTLPKSHPFTDTTDINVENAYMLGLTKGTATDIFSPDIPLTREMAAVMLSKLLMFFQYTAGNNNNTVSTTASGSLTYNQPMDEQQAAKALLDYSTDSNLVSDWAKTYMADVYTHGILLGIGEGRLDPKSYITREQAAILSLNVLSYCDELQIRAAGVKECVLPMPTGIFISQSYYKSDIYLRWNDIPLAAAYDVTIFKDGIPSFTKRVDNNYLDLRTRTSTYNRDTKLYVYTNYSNPLYSSVFGTVDHVIHATIKVVPVNSSGEPSVFSLTREFTIEPWVNKNEMIFGDPSKTAFASTSEADMNMTNITVNVWNLTSFGTKTTSTLTFAIHKNVAENVIKIFSDIYNGQEKFPIKSCSAYSYRSGKSEHNNGTAIDINPDENYFVQWGGVIMVGTLWKPGENPYSIIPGGDVVRAFNRYGWHWSPDMHWSNGADYMHFSLGGT